jgi:hypothetical protein
MSRADIEHIAKTVLRDYGAPFRFGAVSPERQGQCTIGFSDMVSGAAVSVGIWCDDKVSAHHVRESIKRALRVADE